MPFDRDAEPVVTLALAVVIRLGKFFAISGFDPGGRVACPRRALPGLRDRYLIGELSTAHLASPGPTIVQLVPLALLQAFELPAGPVSS